MSTSSPIQPLRSNQWVLRSSILLVLSLLSSSSAIPMLVKAEDKKGSWEYSDPAPPNLNDDRSKDEWKPKPKMIGSPVASNEKNSRFSSFNENDDDAENVKAKAGIFTGACSRSAPFSFKVGGKAGRVVIGTPSAASKDGPQSLATSISFENASEVGSIKFNRGKIQQNLFSILGASTVTESAAPGNQRCVANEMEYEEFYDDQWNPRPLAQGTKCCPNPSDGGKTIMMQFIDSDCPSSSTYPSASSFVGIPADYEGRISKSLSTVTVECSESETPVDVIALVTDSSRKFVHASVTHVLGTDGDYAVKLIDDDDDPSEMAPVKLHGEVLSSIAQKKDSLFGGRRRLEAVEGTPSTIMLKSRQNDRYLEEKNENYEDSSYDYTLVHAVMKDSDDMDVPRTFVVATEKRSLRHRKLEAGAIKLESSDIDENGDIAFKFASLHHNKLGDVLKIDARIGVASECNDEVIGIVDMSAMFATTSQPTLIVNGGWFRRAKEVHGIQCDSWEPVIIDAVITDPEMKYSRLVRLESPIPVTIMKDEKNGRLLSAEEQNQLNSSRKLLREAPSAAELEINEEMTQGRRPERFKSSSDSTRSLEANLHKRILVHGYCYVGSPFPISHFSNAIEFSDPATSNPKESSWTVDTFARKIDKFANDNGIRGCGIIAHSQGGMAALHLFNYYWSCIDYPFTGSRSIQSVGTPYRGTNLSGAFAAIGSVFGQSCGFNYDMTEEGANNWLRNINSVARSNVNYYTTSVMDNWWSYDYCHIATDLFLSNPEDGVIEKGKGQLSGGNNRGHTDGQCHAWGMAEMPQFLDAIRNWQMNNYARY